jgi:hypothetical protein
MMAVEMPAMFEAKVLADPRCAVEASKAVNVLFPGATVLDPTQYAKLVCYNPDILVSIVDPQQNQVGFFDVFPIRRRFALEFINGKMGERSFLRSEAIYDSKSAARAKYIYIGTLLAFRQKLTARECLILEYSMISALYKYIFFKYPPLVERRYFALASTRLGDRWLRACHFSVTAMLDFQQKKRIIYELSSNSAELALRAAEATALQCGGHLVPIRCSWQAAG